MEYFIKKKKCRLKTIVNNICGEINVTSIHRRTYGPRTYVRMKWLIDLVKFGYPFFVHV